MKLLKQIDKMIVSKAKEECYPYFAYGLFQTISNPIYYLIWYFFNHEYSYDAFIVRVMISLLCIPLLFHKFFSEKFLRVLPYYWHITILYSLPFFFTFMLLNNNFSYEWSLNSLTGLVLCIIFIDIPALLFLLPTGIGLGVLLYHVTTSHPFYPFGRIQAVIITYTSIIIFGKLFIVRNSLVQKLIQREKEIDAVQQSLRAQAAAIAHEMRTPLSAVYHMSQGLKMLLPDLIKTQEMAQEKGERVPNISRAKLQTLSIIPKKMERIYKSSTNVIDMLLSNLRGDGQNPDKKVPMEDISLLDCVEDALDAYCLNPIEKRIVHTDKVEGLIVHVNPDLLKHVFFNLLKNALYYVKSSGKEGGSVTLWTEQGKDSIKLHFKDTGKGISAKNLPFVFDKFYSRTDHGTGVGLSFCKMVMEHMDATITCDSVEGEFTQFTLSFPIPLKGEKKL